VRFPRFVILTLICCFTIQGFTPLLANGWKMPRSHSSPQDQFPFDDSDLPVPLEEHKAKWEISDCPDEFSCLFALPSHSNPFLGTVRCLRNLSGFSSSREMLSTLHRLRI
jgi:hypothetical protein